MLPEAAAAEKSAKRSNACRRIPTGLYRFRPWPSPAAEYFPYIHSSKTLAFQQKTGGLRPDKEAGRNAAGAPWRTL